MKYTTILTIFSLTLFFQSCVSDKLNDENFQITADLIDPENPPVLTFSEPIFNFDTVALGAEVAYTFLFKNTGKTPLLINSVKAGCGCTVLKGWPKTPIEPGQGGEIPVILTTKRTGYTKKYISILANTKPATSKLFLEGYVAGL
jgi:archaellum component FlaG (FlaF/FlaG flagellin family)